MKSLAKYSALGVILLSLTACGPSSDDAEKTEDTAKTNTVTQEVKSELSTAKTETGSEAEASAPETSTPAQATVTAPPASEVKEATNDTQKATAGQDNVPLQGSDEWFAWVDKIVTTSDTQGHGPDVGGDEWCHVIDRKLFDEKSGHKPCTPEWNKLVTESVQKKAAE